MEAKPGKGQKYNLIKGRLGKFSIGTVWNYISNQAADAVTRWFNGKEGKGGYGWLHRAELKMNAILMPPVLERNGITGDDEMRCRAWWVFHPLMR